MPQHCGRSWLRQNILTRMNATHPATTRDGWRHRARAVRRCATPASYLGIAFAITAPVWLTQSPRLLGASADSALHVWFLVFMAHALAQGQVPFFSAAATYPHTISLVWNNADILLTLVTWPVALAIGWVRAANLLHLLLLAAGATMMAVALRRHVRSEAAAWVGGLAFGFAPFVQGQLVDGQLTWLTTGTLPLGWWIAEHASAAARSGRHRVGWGFAVGGWVGLQYLVNKEFLATTLLIAVCVGAWPLWRRRCGFRRMARRWASVAAVAVPTAVFLLAYPLVLQTERHPSLIHAAGLTPVRTYIDLLSWVLPSPGQLVSPGSQHPLVPYSMWWPEVVGYLGAPVIGFCLWTLVRAWQNPLVRVAAAVAIVGGCFASGEWLYVSGVATSPLPGWLLHRLPIYADTVPSRFAIFVDMGVAVLLAIGVDRLVNPHRSRLVPLALSALLFLPWLPPPMLLSGGDTAPSALPPVFHSRVMRSLPVGSVVVVAPVAIYTDGGPMLWQALDGFRYRQPFGYILHPDSSGAVTNFPYPSALGSVLVAYADHQPVPVLDLAAMRVNLDRWHVRALVVVSPLTAPATVAIFRALTGRPPRLVEGADVWLRSG
ncbi:MAG TPA: hypothetical protein VMV09_03385 [Candidatus Saccharimonadales bacterium]|nr:hypothetical protein [Candidatus Saccharimonadales bacterium]